MEGRLDDRTNRTAWSGRHRVQVRSGIGVGRIRDVTPVVRALRMRELLRALGVEASLSAEEERTFLPPSEQRQEIDRLPYEHDARQTVVYETEPGEFSALCPFFGLADYGVVRVEYVPGDWILELKSLKYYFHLLAGGRRGAGERDGLPLRRFARPP